MLHLLHILKPIQRHHPEIVSDFIVDYCTLADAPADESYHYGWGSLKWALSYVAETDSVNVGLVLFNLLCESIAKEYDNTFFETNILKFHSLKNYRSALREIDPVDVTAFPYEMVNNYKIVINTTGRQLSAMILRRIPDADIIISAHPGSYPSVKLRTIAPSLSRPVVQSCSRLVAPSPSVILDLLGTVDGGWIILSNASGTTIINHSDIDITASRILEIITPAL